MSYHDHDLHCWSWSWIAGYDIAGAITSHDHEFQIPLDLEWVTVQEMTASHETDIRLMESFGIPSIPSKLLQNYGNSFCWNRVE